MEPEVTLSVVLIELTSYHIWYFSVYLCARGRVSPANSPLPVCLLFTLVPLVAPASSSVPFLLPLTVVACAAAPVPLFAAAPPSAAAPATRPPVAQNERWGKRYSADSQSADHSPHTRR